MLGLLMMPLSAVSGAKTDSARFKDVLTSDQNLSNAITVLTPVAKGLTGTFEQDGKVIYFKTRRGPRTPASLRAGDPDTPEYEIDIQFLDDNGEPFLTQIGGDKLLDNLWDKSKANLKDKLKTKNNFDLADQALTSLKKLKFKNKYKYEQKALIDLAPVVESAQVTEAVEGASAPTMEAQANVVANNYSQRIEIHHKSCCLGLGRHSATIGKYSLNGVTTTAVITCNHGTCAGKMPLKCSWTSAPVRNAQVKNNTSCSTSYNATSFFGHNSNDDTDLQYRSVRFNRYYSTTSGVCNDASGNTKPTWCY
jgi:hypothetical protein